MTNDEEKKNNRGDKPLAPDAPADAGEISNLLLVSREKVNEEIGCHREVEL